MARERRNDQWFSLRLPGTGARTRSGSQGSRVWQTGRIQRASDTRARGAVPTGSSGKVRVSGGSSGWDIPGRQGFRCVHRLFAADLPRTFPARGICARVRPTGGRARAHAGDPAARVCGKQVESERASDARTRGAVPSGSSGKRPGVRGWFRSGHTRASGFSLRAPGDLSMTSHVLPPPRHGCAGASHGGTVPDYSAATVTPGHASVRKGLAGSPAPL